METDRNLLFGVFALQADLITPAQFAEARTEWTTRPQVALGDLLVEHGWLTPAGKADVERLPERKLRRQGQTPLAAGVVAVLVAVAVLAVVAAFVLAAAERGRATPGRTRPQGQEGPSGMSAAGADTLPTSADQAPPRRRSSAGRQ